MDLKHTQLELDYEKLKSEKGSRASIVQEANADLLRELERYSGQLKDTLKENGELKTLYLQVGLLSDKKIVFSFIYFSFRHSYSYFLYTEYIIFCLML